MSKVEALNQEAYILFYVLCDNQTVEEEVSIILHDFEFFIITELNEKC